MDSNSVIVEGPSHTTSLISTFYSIAVDKAPEGGALQAIAGKAASYLACTGAVLALAPLTVAQDVLSPDSETVALARLAGSSVKRAWETSKGPERYLSTLGTAFFAAAGSALALPFTAIRDIGGAGRIEK